jgi:hypothetical protein
VSRRNMPPPSSGLKCVGLDICLIMGGSCKEDGHEAQGKGVRKHRTTLCRDPEDHSLYHCSESFKTFITIPSFLHDGTNCGEHQQVYPMHAVRDKIRVTVGAHCRYLKAHIGLLGKI